MKKIFEMKNIALILAAVLIFVTLVSCKNNTGIDLLESHSSDSEPVSAELSETSESTSDTEGETVDTEDSQITETTTDSDVVSDTSDTESAKETNTDVREGTDNSNDWNEFNPL